MAREAARSADLLSDALRGIAQFASGWTVWVDMDDRLRPFWTMPSVTSVLIVDGNGTITLPPTAYPLVMSDETAEPQPDPGALDELRSLLAEVVKQ